MNLGSRFNQHSFAMVPAPSIPRSRFDRSFTVKDTMEFDYLNPIFVDEVLPGDTVNLNINTFVRLATQKVPILDNLWVDYYFFYCPSRLLWTNWKKFMGEQDNPGDSISYTIPQVTIPANGPEVGELADKFGLPTDVAAGYSANALPFRMYNKVWNEWFRDQNLQNSVTLNLGDGPDTLSDTVLLKVAKKPDYFTTASTAPQKGSASTISLSGTPTVSGTGNLSIPGMNLEFRTATSGGGSTRTLTSAAGGPGSSVFDSIGDGSQIHSWNPAQNVAFSSIASGLSVGVTGVDISVNDLRLGILVQSLLELMMIGGTRYVEIILAHFGVVSPDFRLARSEFLGGGSSRINIHPVAQTAITSGSNALAQLGAFGTSSSSGQNIGFSKSFTEHGYIMALCSARADVTYQQGLNKMWSRSDRFTFYWPKLQQLGEQVVYKGELLTKGTSYDTEVFGYQERHAEYRYRPSEIHGKFRSQYATSIDQWHMAEELSGSPALNSTFIVRNTPIDRSIAVTGEPALLFDAWIQYFHARPMMTYAIPATLGRF